MSTSANKNQTQVSSDGQKRGIASAALVVAGIGLPLLLLFGSAAADGLRRQREAPIRSVLGNSVFERLQAGETTRLHYHGNNRSAPDFSLPDGQGGSWSLADHRGKVIVLNFWSITCPPCVREMPSLEALQRLANEDWGDVEVVAVTSDENFEAIQSVIQPSTSLTVLFDPERNVTRDLFGSELFPETWIIDRQGVIRFRYDGERDWSSPLMLDIVNLFR